MSARVHSEATGAKQHGRLQAVHDVDGEPKADEGQHRSEGGCHALPKHRRRATLPN